MSGPEIYIIVGGLFAAIYTFGLWDERRKFKQKQPDNIDRIRSYMEKRNGKGKNRI